MSKNYMDKKLANYIKIIQQELKWGNHYREGFTRQEIEIAKLNNKFNKIREIIFSDNSMSYRLALSKQILKEEEE